MQYYVLYKLWRNQDYIGKLNWNLHVEELQDIYCKRVFKTISSIQNGKINSFLK